MAGASFGKRVLAALLAAGILFTASGVVFADVAEDLAEAPAETAEEPVTPAPEEEQPVAPSDADDLISYTEVKKEYKEKGYKPGADEVLVFGTKDGVFTDGAVVGVGESSVILADITDDNGETRRALDWNYWDGSDQPDASTNKQKGFTFTFDAASDGLYYLNFDYMSIKAANAEITRTVSIDGVIPFAEAEEMPLFKSYIEGLDMENWADNGGIQKTDVGSKYDGDDIRPSMMESFTWLNQSVYDNQYRESEPLKFYLTAGSHTLTLQFDSQPAYYSAIRFIPAAEIPSYADYNNANKAAGYKAVSGASFVIEGEHCSARTSSGVRRDYNTDPSSSKYSYSRKILNTVGGENWNEGGEAASWTVNVETAGLYRIGFRYEQSWNEGLPSFRQLTINGEIPFEEAKEIGFAYGTNLRDITVGADKVDGGYLFYLEPGDVITLTVVMGEYSEVLNELEDIVDTIMDLYSEIRVVTGSDPDSNYDYKLERYLPTIKQDLMGIRDRLLAVCDRLYNPKDKANSICPTRPGMVSNFRSIAEDFEKWHDDIELIPGDMGTLTGNATNITTWVTEMKSQRLEIDVVYLGDEEAHFVKNKAGFFDRLVSFFVNLWLSFFKDYNNIGITDGANDHIDVWVGRGTEYCEILREQIKRDFTPKTGIGVSINILPSGQLSASGTNLLMLSYISGNAPDLVLAGGANDAIEFAIRDAMFPLEGFEDFDEIASRFYPALLDACTYEDHIYALPETMNFLVMFYRTDILEKLGITVPKTWDELYGTVLPVLYENEMQFWYAGGYDLHLYQHGASFYRDDYDEDGNLQKNIRSGLDTQKAYDAFVAYTEMYNTQGLQVAINFYNQFRYGDVPIGIADFATYMQFLIAAPEIAGKWDIADIPQTKLKDENGNEYLSAATTGIGGNYCFIMDNVTNGKYKKAAFEKKSKSAWEFMKWWTSAPIQEEYASEVEAVIGRDARWLSANIEAFKNSAWEGDHLQTIIKSQEMAVVTPNVLGGYYTGRHVTNAFNRTVVSRSDRARDSLIEAVKDINAEIWAKRKEYHKGVPKVANTIS